jgi:hypothetical protein
MKTLKIVFIVLITIIVVLATGLLLVGFFKPKPSGLLVDTTPVSSVYINGNLVGKTPYTYSGTDITGQIGLKLVPEVSDKNLIPYETKINLQSGIQTVVRREFGDSEDTSSGDVISFDKTSGKSSGLVVISTPDNSQVLIDGVAQGFSPYNTNLVTVGSHNITLSSPGFAERSMSIKTVSGYRLTVFAKLAKSQELVSTSTPSPDPQTPSKTYILIGDTPTGFLRMRTKPGTSGEEIAELKPGSKYLFLEGDAASGWFKIQYKDPAPGLPDGITGWVSNQYAQISTQSGELKSN